MGSVEWNKKEELVAEQALKHLKVCNNNNYYYYAILLLLLILVVG